MKNLDSIKNTGIKELNKEELHSIAGGDTSELGYNPFKWMGYAAYKVYEKLDEWFSEEE